MIMIMISPDAAASSGLKELPRRPGRPTGAQSQPA